MMRILNICIVIPLFFAVSCFADTNSPVNPVTHETNTRCGEIILVTTSDACHCMLERCKDMKSSINGVLNNTNYKCLKFTEIDYARDIKSADEILNKYQADYLPFLVITDPKGKVYYKASYNIKTELCSQACEDLIKKGKDKKK